MAGIADAIELNLFGVAEGTDKTFLGHDYLRQYSRLFQDFRHSEINVLEIGVANGASLRTWQKYFSKATIIGIDIRPGCAAHADDRIIVEIGSQADEAFLNAISDKYRPTLIIDDGSHVSDHQIISLECLFPKLPDGGIYVVEDMFFQVNPASAASFRGSGPVSAMDYLLAAARDRSSWLVPDDTGSRRRSLIYPYLDRVEFFNGCAALFKRKELLAPNEIVRMSYDAVNAADSPRNEWTWSLLYNYAVRCPERLEIAEEALENAFDIDQNEVWYRSRMIRLRQAQGRLASAIVEARRGVEMTKGTPQEADFSNTLAELLAMAPSAP